MRKKRLVLSLLSASLLLFTGLTGVSAADTMGVREALERSGTTPGTAVKFLSLSSHSLRLDQPCTITGTPGNDVLTGTEGADVICGNGGADRIIARGGNDIIITGANSGPVLNAINPGTGDDIVFGGSGGDQINCANASSCTGFGDGSDTAYLGDGMDSGFMGNGRDFADGGLGNDTIWGEGDNDTLYALGGIDTLLGGSGNDYMEGHGAGIALLGGAGNDVMFSITPALVAPTAATGGTGNDLAMLLDGTIDTFIAEEEPTTGGPILGTPCSFTVGSDSVAVTCELLPGLSMTIDDEGEVTYSSPVADFAAQLRAVWTGGGLVKDTCYCDTSIAGFPAFARDTVL